MFLCRYINHLKYSLRPTWQLIVPVHGIKIIENDFKYPRPVVDEIAERSTIGH
ncbi:hypothetical protein AM571_PC01457 (plasmid) [Rhizobium etli 8C-3]|uniref:Uncharacterized protein n=1 Tax=Rhizobium etli 8C-3 TaxID=538025 RepID=A0A1L5PG04_RHIET|nr:hypothetical protein AM571_PC01457 [Rhizobium etli 8C-3]